MSVPALMSGGRARLLGAKALTFQEEQRKQRWPGGYREAPRARLAGPSLPDPQLPDRLPEGPTVGTRLETGRRQVPRGPPSPKS